MVSRFHIDSDNHSGTGVCARLHVEADIHPFSFEINTIRDEDTWLELKFEQLSAVDRLQIMKSIKRTMRDISDSIWGRWVFGRDGI